MTDDRTAGTRAAAQAMYDAGARLDLDGFLAVIDPAAEVHEPTCLPYGGTYHGTAEIQTLFAKVNEHLDLSTIRVDHLLAEADHAVATVRINVRATGAVLLAQEHSVIRDGRITELRIFFFDPTLVNASSG